MHGGYRGSNQQTYGSIYIKPDEEKKEESKTIIKEVIKKDTGTLIGATTGATIGSLLVGAIGGIAAYRAYQNQPPRQGVGFVPPIIEGPAVELYNLRQAGPAPLVNEQPAGNVDLPPGGDVVWLQA